jgi:hypothetical protein
MAGEKIFAGQYSAKYHPWCIEMSDTRAPFICSMKGAQLGVTEVAINRAFFTLDILKKDVLYVLPTATTATDFSKARFGSALALSPYIRSMFSDVNAAGIKQAGANTLYIRGSRGDSNLVSIPVSDLILDEVDRMDQDQIWNAIERLSGKIEKSIFALSTPTTPKHGVHKLWLESTQEYFYFKCPSCSKFIHLTWPDCIEIIGEEINDPRIVESFIKCPECKQKLNHLDKPEMFKSAKWVPTAANANPAKRGFHINQLYSYTLEPRELVEKYFRGMGSEIGEKEFHNNSLGIPFIGSGAKVTDDMVSNALKGHSKDDPRPAFGGQRIITMGVDQGKWNYVEVCEWFFDKYDPDLNTHARCKVLYECKFLDEHFHSNLNALMQEWQVLAAVIDWQPSTMDARRFARRFPGFVWLCRYGKKQPREVTLSDDEDGAPVITADRSYWMSVALGRFKTNPTRIILPHDVSKDYVDHIKSPVATYIRDEHGNPELDYVSNSDDHFAHARTYAEMALPLVAMRVTNSDITRFL